MPADVLGNIVGRAVSFPHDLGVQRLLEWPVCGEVGKHEDKYVCRDIDISEQDLVQSLKELESHEFFLPFYW